MKPLTTLLSYLPDCCPYGNTDLLISAIEFDSRKIKKSEKGVSLYIAQKGIQTDGHLFIPQAILQGAKVIVCEQLPEQTSFEITCIQVKDTTIALGLLAAAFYDFPAQKLKLVGITGTNGKTTTVTLLHQLFMNLGYPTGLISTIVNKINEREVAATHTTPDVLQLNRLLHEMVEAGCAYCFMEVSSHAIVQKRIHSINFAGGVFSNITHDHLDFHKTFANYIDAKKAFFDALPTSAFALTNIDDKNGKKMVESTKAKVFKYSFLTGADFKGKILDNSFEGLHAVFNQKELFFKLCGSFNAYNLLAIYAVATLLGMDEDEVLLKMSNLDGAKGRFQVVRNQRGSIGIVDYAHTPDALKNVLSTIKDITQNSAEIITVVGCGGDRDKLKRPVMAETACNFSHKVILTSDNPRTEDPNQILSEMEQGVPVAFKRNVLKIENRREAIKTACMMLADGGILLIAGKGHEDYQEINGVKEDFDDMKELFNNFEIK